jgi:DNA-binding NarL/FixJ family response regulator
VDQIGARLGDRFGLLTSGDRTAPPRQRTLRAAIDWSHDLLTEPERVMLRRLSAFAGWPLEMAEQLCPGEHLPAAQVLDLLAALADKSLVVVDAAEHGQVRYRMLDTIREYAAARLADAGETAMMRQRLRDYTLGEAERLMHAGMARTRAPWPVAVEAFRRFDAENANLRQVLSHCAADGDAATGLRIAAAMSPVWVVRGAFAEGAEWLDTLLGLGGTAPAAVRGPALVARAQLTLTGDPGGARARAAEGLELCRASGQGFWAASALNLLTEAALHAGRIEEAAEHGERALAVARAAGDRWNEGYALGTLAAVAGQRGDLLAAGQRGEAALAVMRGIDQQWGVARTLLGLAALARLTGEADAAQQRYAEALAILRVLNARPEIARCLAGLGRIAVGQGQTALGREHLTESIELSRAIGNRIGMVRGLEAFAGLALAEQRPDRAVILAAAAAALREASHLPPQPSATTERFLGAAQKPDAGRLWVEGSGLDASAAVDLALDAPPAAEARPPAAGAAPPGGGGSAAGGLTPRERQIVALIAEGRSNKAIGQELTISPATAARHVANILLKLGLRSRAQIAAWAVPARGDDPPEPPGHGDADQNRRPRR